MSDHYCCKRCRLRYDECKCGSNSTVDSEWDGSPSPKRKPSQIEQLQLDVKKLTNLVKTLEKRISNENV